MGLRVSKQLQRLRERKKSGGSLGSLMWPCIVARKPEVILATALTSFSHDQYSCDGAGVGGGAHPLGGWNWG